MSFVQPSFSLLSDPVDLPVREHWTCECRSSHCTLSSDNWRPICSTYDVLQSERTFITARRCCGVFVILVLDTKLQTYLLTYLFTCAKDVMFYPLFVRLHYLLATSCKDYWSWKFYQTRKNWLHFGSQPLLHPDLGIFKNSSILRDGEFFDDLTHISW